MTLTDEDRALIESVLGLIAKPSADPLGFDLTAYELAALLSAARQALSPNNPAGQAMEGDHG